jgi:hypothetical protein
MPWPSDRTFFEREAKATMRTFTLRIVGQAEFRDILVRFLDGSLKVFRIGWTSVIDGSMWVEAADCSWDLIGSIHRRVMVKDGVEAYSEVEGMKHVIEDKEFKVHKSMNGTLCQNTDLHESDLSRIEAKVMHALELAPIFDLRAANSLIMTLPNVVDATDLRGREA